MITKLNQKNQDSLSILGFGCMRLPTKGGVIDEQRATSMIHYAIDNGINYFDTAYIYSAGKNEAFLGRALGGGYREKVKIATKLPPFMVKNLASAKKIFSNQLAKLQTDYIDYYLIHMLSDKAMFSRMVSLGVIDWLESEKNAGTIKNLGFSFHGSKKDFEEIVLAYNWDFCQIQYNYLDENNQATKSGLELAYSLGIPVIVMEPLRGGQLVNKLPKSVTEVFEKNNPERTPAEWALRWIWNHKEINVVLSGMSTEAQLEENIKIAKDAKENSLTEDELRVFDEVKQKILEKTKVPCTACGYCMPCPHGVNIPGCFASLNERYLLDDKFYWWKYMQTQGLMSKKPSYASMCVECGKCELHCPQNIAIRKELKLVSKQMEGIPFKIAKIAVRRFLKINK